MQRSSPGPFRDRARDDPGDDRGKQPGGPRQRRSGPRPVDPALVPMAVLRDRPGLAHSRAARTAFRLTRPLLTTSRPRARLRAVEHRGVLTAAMVYDALPVIDVFRRIGPDAVIGAMDMRGLPAPFFFLLEREEQA
ncbi:MAG TPA: DUF4334 domain-containing protein [Propionibacteriaceae bacterium]|nr:DUF4334 domain-containing protein [Propionibacteriaceae bacterium]